MSGRGGGSKKQGGSTDRREGRGSQRGGGRGHNAWGAKSADRWGGSAQPQPPQNAVVDVPDPDPTPITCDDGFTYPPMTSKVGQALRSLRNPGEIDDQTRPILVKWEEKVRVALKVGIQVPNPPNWQAAAPRTGGWGSGTATTEVSTSFLSSAAGKAPKKPHHNKKKPDMEPAPTMSSLQSDPRLKEKIMQQNAHIMQTHQKLVAKQDQLFETVVALSERLERRDDAIAKLSQYLSQLTGKDVPMLYPSQGTPDFGGYPAEVQQKTWNAAQQQPETRPVNFGLSLQKKAP